MKIKIAEKQMVKLSQLKNGDVFIYADIESNARYMKIPERRGVGGTIIANCIELYSGCDGLVYEDNILYRSNGEYVENK